MSQWKPTKTVSNPSNRTPHGNCTIDHKATHGTEETVSAHYRSRHAVE